VNDRGDPELVERLRREIERDGPITFERFMTVALYDPEHGYYTRPEARPTRAGDFLTAPELHPVFGRMVGRQLTEMWERLDRPSSFVLREHGAGAGTLGLAVIQGLRTDRSALADHLRYEPVESNPHRLAELRARFAAAGLDDRLGEPDPEPIVGVVLANELLDALPVHRIEVRGGTLVETRVGWRDGGFVDIVGPPSTSALGGRLADDGVTLAEGQRGEICLALDPWVAEAAASLERGYLVVIDYGHPAAELYAPRRRAGTLLAYRGHRVSDDPYAAVGRQDLTAHVDLTALDRAATSSGLAPLGSTTQGRFLASLGMADVLAEAAHRTVDELGPYLELRASVVRLLDPRALGGFRVVVFGRGVPGLPRLRGLGAD
jgi:SAM-dependent MidA family methyltransferase